MTDGRMHRIAIALALGFAACTKAAEPPPAPDLSGIEEKLDALGATLDAHAERMTSLEGKLQALTEESEARKLALEEAKAAPPAPPPELPRPRPRSPDLKDPFAPDPPEDTEEDPPEELPAATDRTFDGQETSIECPREGLCVLEKKFFRGLFDQEDKLMKQARIVPSQKDGKTQGYKFYGIRRGSLPKALGIKNGDMLVEVDGKEVRDVVTLVDELQKLRKKKEFDLEFVRKGKGWVLSIEVK